MNTEEIIIVSLFAFMTVALWVATYFCVYRNCKVRDFRSYIIDLCADFNRRHVMEILAGYDVPDPYRRFLDKHTFIDMVSSFKPLRLEAWFTEEEIKELMS